MAYISKEDVKAIRDELKATFPKFKFGVRKATGSMSVNVTVKQGPTDFSGFFAHGNGYAQINHYHTGNYGEHAKFFEEIVKIIKTAPINGNGYHKGRGHYDNSDAQFDYYDTAYYMSLDVGKWNDPYTVSA